MKARATKLFSKSFFMAVILLCIGAGIGWIANILVPTTSAEAVKTDAAVRVSGKYKLVSPLLLCATYQPTGTEAQNAALKNALQNVINSSINSGAATDVSVYIRGFNGNWIGIGENESYVPASLLKVPLMIAYYKEAEADPSVLNRTVSYNGSYDDNESETFKSPSNLKPGTYTIEQLIDSMIINSDNNATRLLDEHINPQALATVYSDLGLTLPENGTASVAWMSAKQYSYFFRVLYNATYLTPEYSEHALELLTKPDFPRGLESSVPHGIAVANKFGERSVFNPNGTVTERELHDCGIVYAKNPYLLCVMTRGKDFNNLTKVIQSVGKVVYQKSTEIAR
jgi:beta-lactamase class A